MSTFQKVTIVGNLGADPEIRRTQDGRPIATLRVATSEKWKDRNTGEDRERTEWHRVVVFNEGLCAVIEKFLKKGRKVLLEGKLQTRKWQDQDGKDRYSTEIVLQGFNATLVMLGGSRGTPDYSGDDTHPDPTSSAQGGPAVAGENFAAELDDEIPF